MKPTTAKICFCISSAAFLFLMVSSARITPLLFCLGAAALWALLIAKSKDPLFCVAPALLANSISSLAALLLCATLSINSYIVWINCAGIQQFAAFIGIPTKFIVLPLLALCMLAAVPAVATLLSDFSTIVRKDFAESPVLVKQGMSAFPAGKAFALVAVVYLVGFSSLIRANFNYGDDMGRALEGYRGWEYFSRFLANNLSTLIHTNLYLTDISPLTQFLSVLLLALAGLILLYVVYERKSFSLWELLALVPLGTNPYFLQCISFKFDSPFMALSILASIAPLLLRNSSSWKYILSIVMGTLVLCTTYQASSGIFPMVVILLCFRMWTKNRPGKEIALFLVNSTAGFGIGMVLFKLIVMVPIDSYVSNSLPTARDLLPTIASNFRQYLSLILSDFCILWLCAILLLAFSFWLSAVFFSSRQKLPTLFLAVFATVLMFLMCFGLYPVLEAPSFDARSMYGFGVLITLFCISTAENLQPIVTRLPSILVAWIFFVFSFSYGNALYAQKSYTDFRISLVICDLNDMDEFLGDEPVTVQIDGDIGQAPVVVGMTAQYPVLDRLISGTFCGNNMWGVKGFYGYYGLKNVKQDSSIDLTTCHLPLVKDGMYHTIYSDGTHVLVALK